MNSVIEGRIKGYLVDHLKYKVTDCGVILTKIDALAQMAGFAVDEKFAGAGLGAGPEARVATAIVDLALGGGGNETSEYEIRMEIGNWLRKNVAVMR